MPTYQRLQRYAILVSAFSVVYNAAEGAVSIGLGQESDSRSLIFFGIQSAIETISSAIVVWRFRKVAKPGEERSDTLGPKELWIEKTASLSIGGLLLALALATEGVAIASLALHKEPEISNDSLIFSAVSLVFMILFWLPKRYLARALNSSVMQGEAVCSLSCIQTTLVLFAGSLLYRVWKGGWWVDSATTILLGILFGWEGYKMVKWARDPEFNGGCCKHHDGHKESEESMSELASRTSDVCECCGEKLDCKTAEECQCIKATALEPGSCCTPTARKTHADKHCGRERAITPVPTVKPAEAHIQSKEDTCCSKDKEPPATIVEHRAVKRPCHHPH